MSTFLIRRSLAAAVLLAGSSVLTSQQISGTQRVPQFENDEVSVWKSMVMPNAPLVMHTHQHPRVIIALSGGDMKIVTENGTSQTQHWETGKAYWRSTEEGKVRHADVNAGQKPIEVMVVELKKAP
jgi:beta-alanine degradation protein BauB